MRTRILALALALSIPAFSAAQWDFNFEERKPAWEYLTLNPNTKITLDFRNANIDMVVSFFSRASGATIIKDPNLTTPMTLTSGRPVTLNEAFRILDTTLNLQNYELRHENGLLVIRRRENRGGGGGGMGNFNPEMIQNLMNAGRPQLKVYPLQYANASQVARVVNEVFQNAQNPLEQIIQQMMGGQGGMQGMPGGFRIGQNDTFDLGEPLTVAQGRGGGGGFNLGNMQNRPGGFGGGNNQQNRGGFNFGNLGQMFGGGRGFQVVRASSDDFSNSVIVNAPGNEQRQVEELIKQLDKDTDAPVQPKVFLLNYADANEVAAVVQNVLTANAPRGRGGIGTQNVPFEQRIQQAFRFGNTSAAFGTVVADARTNSLVVTATEANLKLVGDVIAELDQPVTYESSTFVFPLGNARADQVAQLLNQAFGGRTTGQGGTFGGQNRTGANTQNRNNLNNQNRNQTGGMGGGGMGGGGRGVQDDQQFDDDGQLRTSLPIELDEEGRLLTAVTVGQNFGQMFGGGQQQRAGQTRQTARDEQGRIVNVRDLAGQVTVIPDPNTNSLIVVTGPGNVDLLQSILGQLDRIPEQVIIETMIVEATLGASEKFGIEWNLLQNRFGNTPGQTGVLDQNFNVGGSGTQNPIPGFTFSLFGPTLEMFIRALQTDSKFEVLSTPRIFTSNNVTAEINISQRVPYVLSAREDASGNLTFTYAFTDVGIVLTVTPRITANGQVAMDVVQTANDLEGFTTFNAPIINQRIASTTVSVADGATIVLGGIMRSEVRSTVNKIPILGDLPILGNLFRSTDKERRKTELLVLLTPRIVKDPADAERFSQDQRNQLSPNSQRSVDQRYPPRTGGDVNGGGNGGNGGGNGAGSGGGK